MDLRGSPSTFLSLPPELIDHVLSFLSALDLVSVSWTCSIFRSHALVDIFWQSHVNAQLPYKLTSPKPYPSFKALYTAHYPYWFLTRHQLWFADTQHTGKLLLARYNPEKACIEAYSLNAERSEPTFEQWDYDRNVTIHSFHPTVSLDLNQPVVTLNSEAYKAAHGVRLRGAQVGDSNGTPQWPSKLQVEVPMSIYPTTRLERSGAALYSQFMLTRPLPDYLVGQTTQVWPPLIVPSPNNERTRNESIQLYRGLSHKPEFLDEASTSTFRLRRWMEFTARSRHMLSMVVNGNDIGTAGGPTVLPLGSGAEARFTSENGFHGAAAPPSIGSINLRVGEDVTTFATLDPKSYTPTKQKPWRGIWVGDYSGHGCEFLAVLQPDDDARLSLPLKAVDVIQEAARRDLQARGMRPSSPADDLSEPAATMPGTFVDDDDDIIPDSIKNGIAADDIEQSLRNDQPAQQNPKVSTTAMDQMPDESEPDVYKGRIEAIKLTGDPNVPRGEYTFIAPDIGDNGMLRIADEEIFRGARVVRSVGHVALRGFRQDSYLPSQLILVSHDVLAQYWEQFGHVSFYKRVDITPFLRPE